jgi:tetratricopeptide (TPR) repeat protein
MTLFALIFLGLNAFADFDEIIANRANFDKKTVTLRGTITEIKEYVSKYSNKRKFYLNSGKYKVAVEYYLSESRNNYKNNWSCKEGDTVTVTGPLSASKSSGYLGSIAIKEFQLLKCSTGNKLISTTQISSSTILPVECKSSYSIDCLNSDHGRFLELLKANKFIEASTLAKQMKASVVAHKLNSLIIGKVTENLGTSLIAVDDLIKAEEELKEALKYFEKAGFQNNYLAGSVWAKLTYVSVISNDKSKNTMDNFLKALNILQDNFGPDHPSVHYMFHKMGIWNPSKDDGDSIQFILWPVDYFRKTMQYDNEKDLWTQWGIQMPGLKLLGPLTKTGNKYSKGTFVISRPGSKTQ